MIKWTFYGVFHFQDEEADICVHNYEYNVNLMQ